MKCKLKLANKNITKCILYIWVCFCVKGALVDIENLYTSTIRRPNETMRERERGRRERRKSTTNKGMRCASMCLVCVVYALYSHQNL